MFLEIITISAKCQMWLNSLHTQQEEVEVTKTTDSGSDNNMGTEEIEDIRIEVTFVWAADIIGIDLKLD